MAPLILYTADGGPPSLSVLSVVEALGLEIEERKLDLPNWEQLKPEFVKINPQHTAPTLIDGDFILWDSQAINCYLVDKYAKSDDLYPKDLKKRALINQRLYFNSSVLYSHVRSIIHQVMVHKQELINQDDIDETYKACDFLEEFLGDNKWVTGDKMTIADISIAITIVVLSLGLPIDETKYPKITAWLKRYKELPIYIEPSSAAIFIGQVIRKVVDKTLASK